MGSSLWVYFSAGQVRRMILKVEVDKNEMYFVLSSHITEWLLLVTQSVMSYTTNAASFSSNLEF